MKVLVVNCGSSSVKYALFSMAHEKKIAWGLVECIGLPEAYFKRQSIGQEEEKLLCKVSNHFEAVELIINHLLDSEKGSIKNIDEIYAIGHRIVHGGDKFSDSVLVDENVKAGLKECYSIAPLHTPHHYAGIEAVEKMLPGIPSILVFDTAFHQTMPDYVYTYPLPYDVFTKYAVRKYGAHGTSHKYVARRAAQLLDKPFIHCNLITCHLGSGSSISAIKEGRCYDTSMGLTPLDGLMMGTRCGSIDPACVGFLMRNAGMSIDDVDTMMTKKSGLLGVCGVNDMRDVHARVADGDKMAKLALEMLVYRIRHYIGAYLFQMGGKVDALVFTAGVGENDEIVRRLSLAGLEDLGIILNEAENDKRPGEYALISTPESKIKVYIIRTNEELEIANETLALL